MRNFAQYSPRVAEMLEAAHSRDPKGTDPQIRAALWSVVLTQITHFPQDRHLRDAAQNVILRSMADLMERYESEEWLKTIFDPISDAFLLDIQDKLAEFRKARGL